MLSNRSWEAVYEEIAHEQREEHARRLLAAHVNNVVEALSVGARARTVLVNQHDPLFKAVDRVDTQIVHYYQRLTMCLAEYRPLAELLLIARERRALVRNAVTALDAEISSRAAAQPEVLSFNRLIKDMAGTN